MSRRVVPFFFDLLCSLFIGIWLSGGIVWQGRLILSHGADPRRVALLLVGAGYWFFPSLRERSILLREGLRLGRFLMERRRVWGLWAGLLGIGCLITLLQSFAFRVRLWDVGIFHQVLWSLSHGLGFHSSISGAGNFLSDHLVISLGILVPFFKLFQESPHFLPLVESGLIFGGAAAWIYLAEQISKQFSKQLALAVFIFILSFDSLWKNLSWGFHENSIGFFTLSWAYALLFSKKKSPLKTASILFFFLLAAGSKEIILLDIAIAFICWAFLERRNCIGMLLASLGSLGLIISFIIFEKMPHPYGKNYFNRYYSYLGNDLESFIKNIFISPVLVIENIGIKELSKYFWTVFSPWLFLPFIFVKSSERDRRVIWLSTLIPSFASAALSTYYALRRPDYHYVLELWPVLASLTIIAFSKLQSTKLVWVWVFISLVRMDFDPIREIRELVTTVENTQELRSAILKLPRDISISGDELTGAWIAGRKWVTRWPDTDTFPEKCPEVLIFRGSKEAVSQGFLSRCGSFNSIEILDRDWVMIRR